MVANKFPRGRARGVFRLRTRCPRLQVQTKLLVVTMWYSRFDTLCALCMYVLSPMAESPLSVFLQQAPHACQRWINPGKESPLKLHLQPLFLHHRFRLWIRDASWLESALLLLVLGTALSLMPILALFLQ